MKIRNSTNNDLTRIMEIYAYARKFMQNMSMKNGFVHRGTIHVDEDDNPRMAFERVLEEKRYTS